jgi:hypothetical protein
MNERDGDTRDEVLERRARELFDASVDGLDAETLARLGRARKLAVAELEPRRRPAWAGWLPVAAAASAALVAVVVWRAPQDSPAPVAVAGSSAVAEALDVLAAGDDLELLAEDPEFYAWLDQAGLEDLGGQG